MCIWTFTYHISSTSQRHRKHRHLTVKLTVKTECQYFFPNIRTVGIKLTNVWSLVNMFRKETLIEGDWSTGWLNSRLVSTQPTNAIWTNFLQHSSIANVNNKEQISKVLWGSYSKQLYEHLAMVIRGKPIPAGTHTFLSNLSRQEYISKDNFKHDAWMKLQ